MGPGSSLGRPPQHSLEVVSQELKERCLLPNSAHKVSAELLRGLKDPFSYKDKVKVTGRKIWLVKCVAHCKEFLGTLLPAVHSENSTIVQLEEYLRRYIALGYSVPPSIHKYLTSEDAVTSESWDLPITVKANPGNIHVIKINGRTGRMANNIHQRQKITHFHRRLISSVRY